jgi:hypothetical protein
LARLQPSSPIYDSQRLGIISVHDPARCGRSSKGEERIQIKGRAFGDGAAKTAMTFDKLTFETRTP